MAQYKTGTVSITHNTAIVTGTNTTWVTDGIQTTGPSSWLFKIRTELNLYWIDSIDSETQITLAQNYINLDGVNIIGKEYIIMQDYTTNYGWPNITSGDYDWPIILNYTMHKMDQDFYARNVNYMRFSVIPSGANIPVSGGVIYRANESVERQVNRLFFDAYHEAFLYYTGAVMSASPVVEGDPTIWYPQLKKLTNS